MIITNGMVYLENKTFQKQDIYLDKGIILDDYSQLTDFTVVDAKGLFVLPGLIDIHSHGAMNHDFCDADQNGLSAILAYEYAHGITSYCPTTMSLEQNQLLNVLSTINNRANMTNQAKIEGIHMEGPFLDQEKKGAHKAEYLISPNRNLFNKCQEVSGNQIKLVTLSPGYREALSFIEEFRNHVVISLGHTDCDYDTAKKALNAGASHITHLFNAMNPLNHRDPGLIGAALENENCYAELICDGVHIHKSAVCAAFRLFPDRIVLISDSIRATGLSDGIYELGGQKITVKGKKATLNDNTLAGSVSNLYDCMLMAISYGIPPEEAIAAATMNPAKSIGIFDTVGSITPGKRANILLTDQSFHLQQVIS